MGCDPDSLDVQFQAIRRIVVPSFSRLSSRNFAASERRHPTKQLYVPDGESTLTPLRTPQNFVTLNSFNVTNMATAETQANDKLHEKHLSR